ncbi:helix-turn-helix domain-containing protein [Capnocytophaga cynodegmi]|uniref:helix-turn-helix domain-containing protein n=1 Tax=Capnocytophaga cynodegmi TaxID=28189 RepID=UPI001EE20F4D|nr:helix-turn-helix transcriptional regulator [Capnocytophaga cynodegmi]GJQ07515.1 hypothetical protein CAPN010_16730 [Capnocytophaga cynodegmi]
MKINLKNILKRKNIKNVELAQMIDVGKQQITNYCSGLQTPPLSTLEKIAKALNCEMAELLPLGNDFMHFYDEKGEWQGIIKRPVVANRVLSQEDVKTDESIKDETK